MLTYMLRTQVYISEDQRQAIKLLAQKEKKPEAQIIREALEDGLLRRTTHAGVRGLQELVTLGEKLHAEGPADLSTNHDYYLYDAPYAKPKP